MFQLRFRVVLHYYLVENGGVSMPLVHVIARRENAVLHSDAAIAEVVQWLRVRIAQELSCADPGGQLTAQDIEVEVVDRDPKRHFGGDEFDLQVVVYAGEYPDRRANLEERRRGLQTGLAAVFGSRNVHGYVWILPIAGSFGAF